MKYPFIATASIAIRASGDRVWDALTNPELIRKYLFGTEAHSDWKVGSPITYKGVWEGKPYEDKGTIVEIVPGRLLRSTYWSPLGGRPDEPSNYNTVSYELAEAGGQTTLSLHQDNIESQESADHSAGNWASVLKALKTLLEA